MEIFNIKEIKFQVEINGRKANFTSKYAWDGELELTDGLNPSYMVSYSSGSIRAVNYSFVMEEFIKQLVNRLKEN